uniref:Uncharacterized protein n=1 Tax=Romanomermis culicivorax TaxID=13658 RepID=A0A915L5K6_ROMCU
MRDFEGSTRDQLHKKLVVLGKRCLTMIFHLNIKSCTTFLPVKRKRATVSLYDNQYIPWLDQWNKIKKRKSIWLYKVYKNLLKSGSDLDVVGSAV